MNCDLCGSIRGPYFTGEVEHVKMTLCSECKDVGSDVKELRNAPSGTVQKHKSFSAPEHKEIIQLITPDYGHLIRQARERKDLKQEQLASKLALKASQLQAMENGKFEPSLDMARHLEKALGIKLVIEHQEQEMKSKHASVGPVTIGDLLRK